MSRFSTFSGAAGAWGVLLLLVAACGGDERAVGSVSDSSASAVPDASRPRSGPARIILVSMDTVRADRVEGYGAEGTTPTLRRIAAEGVLVRDFYAASNYTLPSTMSIFAGLDPLEHGVVNEMVRVAPEVVTVAEALAAEPGSTSRVRSSSATPRGCCSTSPSPPTKRAIAGSTAPTRSARSRPA